MITAKLTNSGLELRLLFATPNIGVSRTRNVKIELRGNQNQYITENITYGTGDFTEVILNVPNVDKNNLPSRILQRNAQIDLTLPPMAFDTVKVYFPNETTKNQWLNTAKFLHKPGIAKCEAESRIIQQVGPWQAVAKKFITKFESSDLKESNVVVTNINNSSLWIVPKTHYHPSSTYPVKGIIGSVDFIPAPSEHENKPIILHSNIKRLNSSFMLDNNNFPSKQLNGISVLVGKNLIQEPIVSASLMRGSSLSDGFSLESHGEKGVPILTRIPLHLNKSMSEELYAFHWGLELKHGAFNIDKICKINFSKEYNPELFLSAWFELFSTVTKVAMPPRQAGLLEDIKPNGMPTIILDASTIEYLKQSASYIYLLVTGAIIFLYGLLVFRGIILAPRKK